MYFGLLPKSDLRTWRPADRSPDLFHPMSAATDANGNGQGKKRALEDEPKPMYHRDPSEWDKPAVPVVKVRRHARR